jgi:hypothetical protein
VLTGAVKESTGVQKNPIRWLNALQDSARNSHTIFSLTNPGQNTPPFLADKSSERALAFRCFNERPRAHALIGCHEQSFSLVPACGVKLPLLLVRLVREHHVFRFPLPARFVHLQQLLFLDGREGAEV